ncbi:unnamed protein product [Protopolystoma xenopodis]|uniref:Uncharacterized protein n=1 Tax=Protopolystoma xenopodis TaxID=117903 RepID=A0A448X0V1_9PLAT|nr:unnamed protein product [Protopolystoma xenopodis]
MNLSHPQPNLEENLAFLLSVSVQHFDLFTEQALSHPRLSSSVSSVTSSDRPIGETELTRRLNSGIQKWHARFRVSLQHLLQTDEARSNAGPVDSGDPSPVDWYDVLASDHNSALGCTSVSSTNAWLDATIHQARQVMPPGRRQRLLDWLVPLVKPLQEARDPEPSLKMYLDVEPLREVRARHHPELSPSKPTQPLRVGEDSCHRISIQLAYQVN